MYNIELSDQLQLAKIMKDIEEEKQLLENHQVQLGMIEMINALSVSLTIISMQIIND